MATSTDPISSPGTAPAPAPAFPGFDTKFYPTDEKMRTWIDVSPFVFAGYYLTSPCHPDDSWMGNRATLIDMGWNLLPIYVGQQAPGVSKCKSSVLTAARGEADAQDAGQKLADEGFAAGSYLYLDVERVEQVSAGLTAYITAFVAKITNAGFSPAVYCHKHNATDVRAAVLAGLPDPDIRPRFWIVGGVTSHFNVNTSKPTDVGIDFANLWQCPASVKRTFGGVTIEIDEDVSDSADPSS